MRVVERDIWMGFDAAVTKLITGVCIIDVVRRQILCNFEKNFPKLKIR